MSILNQIANPQIADVAGRFEQGRKIGQQNLTKDLAGKILNETLGSKLGMQAYTDLQNVNPEAAMNLKKEIQADSDSGTQYFLGVTKALSSIIENGGTADDVVKYITPQIMIAKEGGQAGVAQRLADTIPLLKDPETSQTVLNNILATSAGVGGGEGKFSAKTDILEDGSTIQTTTTGKRIVKNPEGAEVTGAEAAKIVKAAKDEGIRIQTERAGGRSTATAAVERSEKAFDSVEKIRTSILNLDEGIRLLDEGAETGPIMSLLPSVRSTAVQLDNLQGRLGLDVIGNTTFGALSKDELTFALDVALPKKLAGPELRAWMVRKKDAQTKLSAYLTDVAQFLGTPGNTTADWIELQKVRQLDADESQQSAAPQISGSVDLGTLSIEELQKLRQQELSKGAQ